ncbi:hypothetical protein ACFFJF_12285, partial [Allobacillus sp. GCM10007489]
VLPVTVIVLHTLYRTSHHKKWGWQSSRISFAFLSDFLLQNTRGGCIIIIVFGLFSFVTIIMFLILCIKLFTYFAKKKPFPKKC